MEHDLEEEVAQFLPEVGHVASFYGVRHLVGFLYGVRCDGGEGLLQVPRAAGLRIAQPRHDVQELLQGRRHLDRA